MATVVVCLQYVRVCVESTPVHLKLPQRPMAIIS